MKKILAIVPLALFVLFCRSVVGSDQIDVQKLWPTTGLYSNEELGKLFYNMTFKPYGRKDLAFAMLVSKEWQSVPLKISKEEYEKAEKGQSILPLAELRAPEWNKSRASISMHAVKLSGKIRLESWVDAYIQGNRISPLARRKGMFSGRPVEDVMFRSQQGENTFLVRMTFSCHGSYVFIVSSAALEQIFEMYAKKFSIAAISFEPK